MSKTCPTAGIKGVRRPGNQWRQEVWRKWGKSPRFPGQYVSLLGDRSPGVLPMGNQDTARPPDGESMGLLPRRDRARLANLGRFKRDDGR